MLTTEDMIEKCHRYSQSDVGEGNADSLIGFFQVFRPDGGALAGLFDHLEIGEQLHERLDRLYAACGDDRRPDGRRDAYFVIRRPPAIDPDAASELASDWLQRLSSLAEQVGDADSPNPLAPTPTIRVLEGLPPKHPKADEEKSQLLRFLQHEAANLLDRIQAVDPAAIALRSAYYFVACDAMLRDYLMWPLYAAALRTIDTAPVHDPFEPYFQLWRHGVKYRIFGDRQVDLYLPRETA